MKKQESKLEFFVNLLLVLALLLFIASMFRKPVDPDRYVHPSDIYDNRGDEAATTEIEI